MMNDKEFDLWADGYDKATDISDEENSYPFAGYKKVLDFIFKTVTRTPNPVVLDIGFGTGVLTSKLYENGSTIYGEDFSLKMIEKASKKMPGAHLYQGDFTKGLVSLLKDKIYDYIIATYSLHHLTDKQKIAFINELKGCLKEDGKLIIGDVAFEDRRNLEMCRINAGDAWDEDEIYFVVDEIKKEFPSLSFTKLSDCAGVLILNK